MRNRLIKAGILIAVIFFGIFLTVKPYYSFLAHEVKISPFKTLLGIRGNLKTVNGAVNILLLGIPGGTHDGPTLSDTIVVVHADLSDKTVKTLGIPRDVWSESLRDKINSAYAYGEAKQEGGGMILARAEVAAIIGQPVHYAAVINFDNFRELIDSLGGITVDVERSFTDHKFPIAGKEADECGGDPEYRCRYETIQFSKGRTTMNGEIALKFVRSRQAEGEEGTDFARNKRQELVLAAVKESVLRKLATPSVGTLRDLYRTFDSFLIRDISNQQAADIVRTLIVKKNIQIEALTIPRELFTVPPTYQYDGRYVLIPKDGSIERIHDYVASRFARNTAQ